MMNIRRWNGSLLARGCTAALCSNLREKNDRGEIVALFVSAGASLAGESPFDLFLWVGLIWLLALSELRNAPQYWQSWRHFLRTRKWFKIELNMSLDVQCMSNVQLCAGQGERNELLNLRPTTRKHKRKRRVEKVSGCKQVTKQRCEGGAIWRWEWYCHYAPTLPQRVLPFVWCPVVRGGLWDVGRGCGGRGDTKGTLAPRSPSQEKNASTQTYIRGPGSQKKL